MPDSRPVEYFKAALLQLEQKRDTGQLIALFADDAELDAPSRKTRLNGRAGAEEFWSEYLNAFVYICSRFTREQTVGDMAVLEWVSEGTLPTGRPIEYRGVSLIRFRNGKVLSFTTYYDSAAFVLEPPIAIDVTHGTNNEGGD